MKTVLLIILCLCLHGNSFSKCDRKPVKSTKKMVSSDIQLPGSMLFAF